MGLSDLIFCMVKKVPIAGVLCFDPGDLVSDTVRNRALREDFPPQADAPCPQKGLECACLAGCLLTTAWLVL